MEKKKLGVLLSTPPGHKNMETALGLAEASLARGVEVYMYLVDDGVPNVDNPRLQELAQRGLHLFACAFGAQRRRVPITEKAAFSGLVNLTNIMSGCDRFISLN